MFLLIYIFKEIKQIPVKKIKRTVNISQNFEFAVYKKHSYDIFRIVVFQEKITIE